MMGDSMETKKERPIRATPDDIPLRLAEDAHRWNSLDPERRAMQERQGYVRHIEAVYDELAPLATTDEQRRVLIEEVERYRQGYLRRTLDILSARSRTASPMVTGPSKFPTARNRKMIDREMAKIRELGEWQERALNAMRRGIRDAGPQEDPIEETRRKLASKKQLHEQMKQVNAIIRRRGTDEQKRAAMIEAGIPERLIKVAFSNGIIHGFILRNNLVSIRRLEKRLEELERRAAAETKEIPFDGGVIVENVELDRLQVIFDGKPDEATRARLKRHGFRWAPSQGAWQRQLTNNARAALRAVLAVPAEGQGS